MGKRAIYAKRLGAAVIGLVAGMLAASVWAVSGAAFTTTNTSVDGTGHCKNGNEDVNCNIYDGKQYVWLNGGPAVAYVGDGDYFFAVLSPGGQANPNDGASKNLSDTTAAPWTGGEINSDSSTVPSGDVYTNRKFHVTNGIIDDVYGSTHDFTNNKIRLMPYDDTTNSGGVYILAICSLTDGYPAVASDCKYDAFSIKTGTSEELPPADDLTITKGADGSYTDTYSWTIEKSVDKTTVKQIGGSATFNYTVTVGNDGGTITNVQVSGTITVFNTNVDELNNTVPVDIDSVTDKLSDGTVCTVTDGGAQTLTQAKTDFTYTCTLSALPSGSISNTVTVSWSDQILTNATELDAGSADFTFQSISFTESAVDDCVNVSDSYAGSLGTVCVGDANPTSFTYARTINIPANDCQSYDNTATFTTNDTGATGSASQTVTVCGPAKTGALTIGFWKTTNGQNLIKTYCQNPALANYLKGLGGGSGPFSNAPTTSCNDLASYVSGILTGASATDMNKMLKAQMLGTALDVWFSGPGWTATKIGSIKPPSNFLSHNNLGTFNMDTTAVCPMVDNLSTGSATCKNNKPSTDAVAAGAVPGSPMSMQAILDFAATTPAPFNGSTSSSVWYAGDRTKQEILKNIFDQFNNQLAFGSF